MRKLSEWIRSDKGATAIEYGLLCALIGIAVIAALASISGGLGKTFGTIGNSYTQ